MLVELDQPRRLPLRRMLLLSRWKRLQNVLLLPHVHETLPWLKLKEPRLMLVLPPSLQLLLQMLLQLPLMLRSVLE